MKIDFENSFSYVLLNKGYDYYLSGFVKNVKIKENYIRAVVSGSYNYDVSVDIKNNKIVSAFCNCPYAEGGSSCKHIVALLYYLNNEDIDIKTLKAATLTKEQSISKILKSIDEKELKEFLILLLQEDEKIYDQFRLRFISHFPKPSIFEYKNKIKKAIDDVAGRDGFIDYRESWDYTHKMREFIKEANDLVNSQNFDLAFDLISLILNEIPNTQIDDSNGSTGEISYNCIEVIERILDYCHKDRQKYGVIKKIFDYVTFEIKTGSLRNYGIEVGELLNYFIEKRMFLNEVELLLIDTINNCDDKWYSYYKSNYIELLINVYEILNQKDKILFLIRNNLDETDIFKKYIDIIMNEKQYKDVIKLLKIYRKEYPNYTIYISNTLMNIYEKNKMHKEYKTELYAMFFKYKPYDFETFKKIKSLYNQKEWKTELKNILIKIGDKSKFGSCSPMMDIYIEENMTDEIFALIKNSGFQTIKNYEKYVLPKYNDKILNLYLNICEQQVARASSRGVYQEIANNLKHVKKLKNANDKVRALVSKIKEEYKSRPALMEEISKV